MPPTKIGKRFLPRTVNSCDWSRRHVAHKRRLRFSESVILDPDTRFFLISQPSLTLFPDAALMILPSLPRLALTFFWVCCLWAACQPSSSTHLYQHLPVRRTGTGAACRLSVDVMKRQSAHNSHTPKTVLLLLFPQTFIRIHLLDAGKRSFVLSVCLWVSGNSLWFPAQQRWRVYPQSNSIISIITAIIPCLPLMQANGWPIKIDEPGSVELIGRTWCLASVLTRVFNRSTALRYKHSWNIICVFLHLQ